MFKNSIFKISKVDGVDRIFNKTVNCYNFKFYKCISEQTEKLTIYKYLSNCTFSYNSKNH